MIRRQSKSCHARFTETWDTHARPPRAAEGLHVTAFGDAFRSMSFVSLRCGGVTTRSTNESWI